MLDYLNGSDKTADPWKNLNSEVILFHYRQSPRPLERNIERNIITNSNYYNPPLQFPGEVLVELDTEGRLMSLLWVPPADTAPPGKTQKAPDWEIYFAEAGLKITEWEKTDPKSNPPFFADTQIAWEGTLPNWPGTASRIEASSYQGKAVSFKIMAPWYKPPQEAPEPMKVSAIIVNVLIYMVLIGIIIGLLYFALKNLRLGRGDRRNATRLALFAIGLVMISWLLGTHHVPSGWELVLLFLNLCISLAAGGFLWITYIAIEPFVRRRWPKVLVSWTRLLSGGWRDPLVARDTFIGCAFGVLAYCFVSIAYILIQRTQSIYWPITPNFAVLSGTNYFISAILNLVLNATMDVLILIGILFLIRVIVRTQILVFAVAIIFMAFLDGVSRGFWDIVICLVILYPLWFFVLMRFGLIAGIFFMFSGHIFMRFPVGFNALSTWYAGAGYTALAIFAVIVLYSFRTSLGGRPMFGTSRLDK